MLQKINKNASGVPTGEYTDIAGGTLWADSPIGTILAYGGTTAPSGWMICNGSAVSRTTYSELFAVIGTSFGTGDGSTTFNLPDLRNKTTFGVGSATVGLANVGDNTVGSLPNITGQLSGGYSGGTSNGAFRQSTSSFTFPSGANFNFAQISMDASRESAMYKTTDQVVPASVGVNYIIKAKMVALPADLANGVDEYLETENVLWENQSPSSNFSAQDVTLANDNYRYLTIYYKEYTQRNYYLSVKFPKGAGCYLNKIDVSAIDYYVYNRICSYTNSTELHFDNAYQSSQTTPNNAHLIPVKIVGSMT